MSVLIDPIVLTPISMKLLISMINDIKDWIKLNYDDLMWKINETGDLVIIDKTG